MESSSPNITPNKWLNYFKSLLFDERQTGPINEQDNTSSWEETDQLNLPITQEEVIISINKQSSGKSPGPDGLCIELFKNVATEIAPVPTRIFNIVFVKGVFPKSWGESIICPIHKSGTVHDSGDYRGISLLNIMYKIMSITGPRKMVRLMRVKQVFERVIRQLTIYSLYKQWFKSIYQDQGDVFIVFILTFVKLSIK